MLCDHQLVTEHLVAYIDDALAPPMRQQVSDAIADCATCQQAYRQAVALQQAALSWREQPTPEWHRTSYAVRPPQSHGGWLSWTAMATSTLAILMVIFQVQISTGNGGISIAFGGQSNEQINELVEQSLAEYKQQQAVLLDARFLAAAEKQRTANKLLVADLMEKTRDERRDDLNFLITGIQTQRFEDKNKFEKRISYLAETQIENSQYINQLIQSANLNKGDPQ